MNSPVTNKHVVIAIPVLFVGGTEIQTLNLVTVLKSGGYQVSVCCYYEYDDSMVEEVQAAGAHVMLMKLNREDGLVNLFKKLRHLFSELNPDIVHVQYIAPGLVPIVAAKVAGVKTVFATVHQPGRTYGWRAKFLLRTAARLCNAFFCNSRAVEESWFGNSAVLEPGTLLCKRKHYTIYNSIDLQEIGESVAGVNREELKRSLGISGKKVVGVVGRLREEKGQTVLLDAMVEVLKVIPEVMLVVVGNGPDREKLQQKAHSLGTADHVLWLGQRTPKEVFRLYAIMDIVAVPSLFEGFGLSAAEAMATGVPVVATRVDGLAEVVEDGTSGYLVHVGDSKELAGAITDLLLNPKKAKAMGQSGYGRVKENFSTDLFREVTISTYGYCT
ncbi:MAG TPA: hypothetical protein DCP92_17475 [Nitrospiraceae bacterium]|jgi:glycosyltransferase involved in cell wall biosynthesis|nr:hypothetical protein [Nitrospiraceae bacterium]